MWNNVFSSYLQASRGQLAYSSLQIAWKYWIPSKIEFLLKYFSNIFPKHLRWVFLKLKRFLKKSLLQKTFFLLHLFFVVTLNVCMKKKNSLSPKRNSHVSLKNIFSSFWVICYSNSFLNSRTEHFQDMINIPFILFCFVKFMGFPLISNSPHFSKSSYA